MVVNTKSIILFYSAIAGVVESSSIFGFNSARNAREQGRAIFDQARERVGMSSNKPEEMSMLIQQIGDAMKQRAQQGMTNTEGTTIVAQFSSAKVDHADIARSVQSILQEFNGQEVIEMVLNLETNPPSVSFGNLRWSSVPSNNFVHDITPFMQQHSMARNELIYLQQANEIGHFMEELRRQSQVAASQGQTVLNADIPFASLNGNSLAQAIYQTLSSVGFPECTVQWFPVVQAQVPLDPSGIPVAVPLPPGPQQGTMRITNLNWTTDQAAPAASSSAIDSARDLRQGLQTMSKKVCLPENCPVCKLRMQEEKGDQEKCLVRYYSNVIDYHSMVRNEIEQKFYEASAEAPKNNGREIQVVLEQIKEDAMAEAQKNEACGDFFIFFSKGVAINHELVRKNVEQILLAAGFEHDRPRRSSVRDEFVALTTDHKALKIVGLRWASPGQSMMSSSSDTNFPVPESFKGAKQEIENILNLAAETASLNTESEAEKMIQELKEHMKEKAQQNLDKLEYAYLAFSKGIAHNHDSVKNAVESWLKEENYSGFKIEITSTRDNIMVRNLKFVN